MVEPVERSPKRTRREGPDAADDKEEEEVPPRLRLEYVFPGRSKSQKNMARLWRDGSLCDVEISVDGQTFRAHRNVLAAGSDYMNALLCEDRFKDSTQKTIELVDMAATDVKLVLEWLYEGRCNPKESELMCLLEAASRLQCVDLLPRVEEAAIERLDAETCLAAWDAADRMHLAKLGEAAEAKALRCYVELVPTKEFELLSVSKLSMLLANDKLRVTNEERVFESVVSWAKAQSMPPSADELGDIFDNIRFPLMSESFIKDHVERQQLVVDTPRVMMALYRSMRDKAYGRKSTRTTLRRGRKIIWKDIKQGLRVRVIDNPGLLTERCTSVAPGASENVGWVDGMANLIGTTHTIRRYNSDARSVEIIDLGGFEVPFNALEWA